MGALQISCEPLTALIGQPVSLHPRIEGGVAPYRVSAAGLSGSGLTLAPFTGILGGVPCGPAATIPVLYTVSDAVGAVATLTVPIRLEQPILRGLGNGSHVSIQAFESGAAWSRVTVRRCLSRVGFARKRWSFPTFYLTSQTPVLSAVAQDGSVNLSVSSTARFRSGERLVILGSDLAPDHQRKGIAIEVLDATTLRYAGDAAPRPAKPNEAMMLRSAVMTEEDWPHALLLKHFIGKQRPDGRIDWQEATWNGGAPTGRYRGPGTNDQGLIRTDSLSCRRIEADEPYFEATIVENPLGERSPAGTLPVMGPTSSYVERPGEGGLANTSGRHAGHSFIDRPPFGDGTLIPPFPPSQKGISVGFWPCMGEIDYPPALAVPAIWGDSIYDGVGEGSAGSGVKAAPPVHGDAQGSALGNAGFAARGIVETLSLNCAINLSKGSDGFKYLGVPGNIACRLNLISLANPTHVLLGMIHNDIAAGRSPEQFAADMQAVVTQIRAVLPDVKIIVSLCTPDASARLPVTRLNSTGRDVAGEMAAEDLEKLIDGQQATISGANPTEYNAVDVVVSKTSPTGFRYTVSTPPTRAEASGRMVIDGQFLNAAMQTSAHNFGSDAAQLRMRYHALIRARHPSLPRFDAVYDPNLACEEGYDGTQLSHTGLWRADGVTPYLFTADGTHDNSHGHEQRARALPRTLFE